MVTVNGLGLPFKQTDCEVAVVGELITAPLMVNVMGMDAVHPVAELMVFNTPEYVPAGTLAGI